jgi:triosephosphate isomerase
MSRRKLIAGNWKMHMGPGEAGPLAQAIKKAVMDVMVADVTVAPPYLSIPEVVAALRHTGIDVAAQNLHWEPKGAYTGELSAEMIAASGCTQVIIGHSERR